MHAHASRPERMAASSVASNLLLPNKRVQQSGGLLQQWLRGTNLYIASKRETAGKVSIESAVLRVDNSYTIPGRETAGTARSSP